VNVEKILEGQIGTQKLWPGIENTPLIVGFTKASELAFENFEANTNRMQMLRDKLVNGVFKELTDVKFNGAKGDKRSPDNANISFLRAEGEALTIELSLKGIYVSSGRPAADASPACSCCHQENSAKPTGILMKRRVTDRRGYSLCLRSATYSSEPNKRNSRSNRSGLKVSRVPLPYTQKVLDLFRNPKNLEKWKMPQLLRWLVTLPAET
jgi:hypothetical protein